MADAPAPASRGPLPWIALVAAMGGGAGLNEFLGPSAEVKTELREIKTALVQLEKSHAAHLAAHRGLAYATASEPAF